MDCPLYPFWRHWHAIREKTDHSSPPFRVSKQVQPPCPWKALLSATKLTRLPVTGFGLCLDATSGDRFVCCWWVLVRFVHLICSDCFIFQFRITVNSLWFTDINVVWPFGEMHSLYLEDHVAVSLKTERFFWHSFNIIDFVSAQDPSLGHRPLWPRSLGLGPSHYYKKECFIIVRRAKAKWPRPQGPVPRPSHRTCACDGCLAC